MKGVTAAIFVWTLISPHGGGHAWPTHTACRDGSFEVLYQSCGKVFANTRWCVQGEQGPQVWAEVGGWRVRGLVAGHFVHLQQVREGHSEALGEGTAGAGNEPAGGLEKYIEGLSTAMH